MILRCPRASKDAARACGESPAVHPSSARIAAKRLRYSRLRMTGIRPSSSYVPCQARRRQRPRSPQTPERCRCDDRATVGAKPRDVGQQALIRGFTHVRVSVRGFPCLRTCVDLAIGFKGWSGIPLAVAALPPLHEICLHRTMPRCRLPEKLLQRATHSPWTSRLTWPPHGR